MLQYKKTCRVCQACKKDAKLVNDIFNTTFYMKSVKTTLRKVHAAYTNPVTGEELFKYKALTNHVKKHQFLSQDDFTRRHLNQIAVKAEQDIIRKTIDSKQVWDTIIEKGMKGVEEGGEVKVGHLLKAAKDKSDWEMKQKDQQLAMMEMVFHFTSGENNQSGAYDRRVIEGETAEDYDPAAGVADSLSEGEDRPGAVHYPPSWNAAA